MPLKLGARRPPHNLRWARHMLLSHLTIAGAGLGKPPPASQPWWAPVEKRFGVAGWGMDGNDQVGDCVEAAIAHALMVWTCNGGPTPIDPNQSEVVSLYSAITGYTPTNPASDQGTDPTKACDYLQATGFLGQKIAAFLTLEASRTALDNLKLAIQFFGGVLLCLDLPDYAENTFSQGLWDYQPGQNFKLLGGHCILATAYDPDYLDVVTWGKRILMSYSFWNKFGWLVLPMVSADFLTSLGTNPTGMTLKRMVASLKLLTG
jgi:hypothetical protein